MHRSNGTKDQWIKGPDFTGLLEKKIRMLKQVSAFPATNAVEFAGSAICAICNGVEY